MTIRGCTWGAWRRLADAGQLPAPGRTLAAAPDEYDRIEADLEAAYQRIDQDPDPDRIAAEYLTPTAPTQGRLL